MSTLLQFLSNFTQVMVLNTILVTVIIWMAVMTWRHQRKHKRQLLESYVAGYATADTLASVRLYDTTVTGRHPSGLTFEQWKNGTNLRDVLPRDDDPHMWPAEAGDSMLKHIHRATPEFDRHVETLPVTVLDHRPHVKTKDLRTPMQLVRFDSAGYLPD